MTLNFVPPDPPHPKPRRMTARDTNPVLGSSNFKSRFTIRSSGEIDIHIAADADAA
jgi:hypothetical protein